MRIKARALRHGPAFQDAIKLQPEIIVKARGIMLLDQIAPAIPLS